jgi:hypothetical protein
MLGLLGGLVLIASAFNGGGDDFNETMAAIGTSIIVLGCVAAGLGWVMEFLGRRSSR